MASPKNRLYRVTFTNQGQVYEVYAREVSQGTLLGFVEIGKLVFGERSSVVVDPGEEKLKNEFAHVARFHVPIHAVIRIDEVDRQGAARVHAVAADAGSKVTPFPLYTQGGEPRK